MRYFTEVLWGTAPLCLCRTRPRPLPALASKLWKMRKKILVGPGSVTRNRDQGVITWWGTVNLEIWTLNQKNLLSPQIRAGQKGHEKKQCNALEKMQMRRYSHGYNGLRKWKFNSSKIERLANWNENHFRHSEICHQNQYQESFSDDLEYKEG